MNRYLYIENVTEAPVIIFAKHRPSLKNIPSRGTWVLKEWFEDKWVMPCFPEITYGRILKDLKFIGRIK